jgi:iron complex outermembrane receptor protein
VSAFKAVAFGLVVTNACLLLLFTAAFSRADERTVLTFNIDPQSLASALSEFARESHKEILFAPDIVAQKTSPGLHGSYEPLVALHRLLETTGLVYTTTQSGAILVTAPTTEAIRSRSDVVRLAQADSRQGVASAPNEDSPARIDTSAEAASLPEVLVTARRRIENAQTTPVAVDVFSGDQMQDLQITESKDLEAEVPSLEVNSDALGARERPTFALRGLRSVGVVTYFSEVPADSSVIGRSLYDMESIQVLKGPQGTLFGQNTTAGALLFGPAKPTDKQDGFIELSAGDYSMYGLQGMLNAPLSDKLMVRFAGEIVDRSGFEQYVGPPDPTLVSQDSLSHNSERMSVLYKPTDGVTNLTIVDRFYSDEAPAWSKLVAYAACPANPTIGQLLTFAACKYVPPLTTANGLPVWSTTANREIALPPFETTDPFQGRSLTDSWGAENVTIFDLTDHIDLRNIFGFRRDHFLTSQDTDGTVFPLQTVISVDRNRRATDELQLQGNFDRLTWIVGAYYSDYRTENNGDYGVAEPDSPISPVLLHSINDDKSYALYTQATYRITDRLSLTAGYRQTQEDKTLAESETLAGFCGFAPGPGVDYATCTESRSATFHEPSWTFGPDFKISDNVLAYVTTRRGFNSGGFNLVGPSPTYATEKLTDVEVGLKTDWSLAGRPVRTDVALYRSDYADIQRAIFLFVNNIPYGVTANAASADVYGAELQIKASLSPYFELSAGGSWIDAKYNKFVTAFAPGEFVNLTSNALANAPKVSTTVSPKLHLPVPRSLGSDLFFTVTWAYQSRIYFQDSNQTNPYISNTLDAYSQQAGYSLFNAEIAWKQVMGSHADMRFYSKNLGNKVYADVTSNNLSTYGVANAIYGEPRTWGVSVAYHFGNGSPAKP